jgi:hypothetical protein
VREDAGGAWQLGSSACVVGGQADQRLDGSHHPCVGTFDGGAGPLPSATKILFTHWRAVDEERLYGASEDGTIRICDAGTWAEVRSVAAEADFRPRRKNE